MVLWRGIGSVAETYYWSEVWGIIRVGGVLYRFEDLIR